MGDHVFAGRTLVGKVNIATGKVVQGKVTKTALKILAKRGVLARGATLKILGKVGRGLAGFLGVVMWLEEMTGTAHAATVTDWRIEQYEKGEISYKELLGYLGLKDPDKKIK